MDKNFLEFWRNYLFNLVQAGQKPAGEKFYDDVFNFWSGFMKDQNATKLFPFPPGLFETQLDFLRKFCGLKNDAVPDYLAGANKASEDFHKSLKEFISAFDVVPREDYAQLKKNYAELQEKCEAQDKTIRQLRMKLLVKGAEEAGAASGIQEMIRTQTEQFTALMDSLSNIYTGSVSQQDKPEETQKPKKQSKR